MSLTAMAQSVTKDSEPDGWSPEPGYFGELDPRGPTRLVASVPIDQLAGIHQTLVKSLKAPLSILYRQKVDRQNPRPQAAPPRDFVAVDLDSERVLAALDRNAPIVYSDARAEIWIRGGLNEQLVLDTDGIVFCYPDDPSFRDALDAAGVPERSIQTMADRDYVKHWYHAESDAFEAALFRDLGLQEVPHRKG